MKIIVIGAGAWGTALAVSAAARHQVTLACRSELAAQRLQTECCNAAYLPGVSWGPWLTVVHLDVDADLSPVAGADLVILATPAAAVPQWLAALPAAVATAWLSKGLVASPLGAQLLHEVAHEVCPMQAVGVLSGPSFAQEVAQGLPCALVAASRHPHVQQALVQAFHSDAMRVYVSPDVAGVEVGGAVKNVLAIAAGVCDGLGLGHNARAALITRGLAEMTRLGVALGAQSDTFMGLSGLGDLVLTCTGDLSRNRRVGLGLAAGQSLSAIVASLGHVAEGVHSAPAVAQRAASLGVDMPIVAAMVQLLQGGTSAGQAVAALMARQPTRE